MAHTIITREDAYNRSLRKYFTGVACRAGHIAQRYTSSGNCIDCLNLTHKKQTIKNQHARQRHNAMMAQDDSTFVCTIPLDWQEAFKQLQEFAIQAGDGPSIQLKAIIANMHKDHTTPFIQPRSPMRPVRSVDANDIAKVVKWNGSMATNINELQLIEATEDFPKLRIIIGREQYLAEEIVSCLKGEIKHVQPCANLPLRPPSI